MKNLIVPVAVLAAVGMMIFPLPGFLLDILLAANIAFSIALLVNSLYVRDVNSFSSLPVLLLIATLFRLSLNISTTRQLLSSGNAPQIVTAFGNFVVSGNLVVGIVIFLILTIVQFLVIAKGAERVAEVSARFTLDAMPGKQMAIDADMRSGFISAVEAKEKRLELQRESKLYGALDGAMKFVKGDAIAGLLITAVNITAGILIGVAYLDLGISEAISRYTLFTVGDGLVSQIPAILVSVAAGIVVTQVSDKEGSMIGSRVISQLGREPQAMLIVSVLLLLFSFAPGLPGFPFVFGSLIFLVVSFVRLQQEKQLARQVNDRDFSPKRYRGFVLKMGNEGLRLLSADGNLAALALTFRNKFFEKWGVIIPEISFDLDQSLDGSGVELYLGNHFILEIEKPELVGSFATKIVEVVSLYCEGDKEQFVDDTHTRKLIEIHNVEVEDLVNDLLPETVSITELTGLIKDLIADGIPVTDLRALLQALAEHNFVSAAAGRSLKQFCGFSIGAEIDRLSYVRIKLRPIITKVVADQGLECNCWVVSPQLDSLLAEAIETPGLDLSSLRITISDLLNDFAAKQNSQPALIIASHFTRAYLRQLAVELSLNLRIVASQELESSLQLNIRGEISAEDWQLVEEENYSGQQQLLM